MKKLLSIASILFVVTMLFSACTTTTTENPFEDLYKFKSTYFEGYAKVNGNFLDLVDFTLTYTGLDGTTKNITPNAKGEYIIEDMGYKLPADIKVVCTMTKKANYEEIKASMEEFDIDVEYMLVDLILKDKLYKFDVDHFIKSIDDEYLLSFDNSKIDSPVLDLISLYKNTYMYKSFKSAFDKYLYHYDLNEDELKLFFINICVFDDFDINKDDEFENLRSINKLVNYVLITDELVRPYYFVDNEEK